MESSKPSLADRLFLAFFTLKCSVSIHPVFKSDAECCPDIHHLHESDALALLEAISEVITLQQNHFRDGYKEAVLPYEVTHQLNRQHG